MISKISKSTLPGVTSRWLSCYLRGRQAVTSCRGVKSTARIVHTGDPQGSKLSPSLFSFYLANMPRPTYLVKRICYADDISVWASGAEMPELHFIVRSQDQRLLERDVRVLEVQLSDDISPKVNSCSLYPRYEVNQVPPRHQDSWLSTSTELQPEDLRCPPGHIPNFQPTLHTSGNKSQQ